MGKPIKIHEGVDFYAAQLKKITFNFLIGI